MEQLVPDTLSLQHCPLSIGLTSCLSIGGDPDGVGTATAAGQVGRRGGHASLRVVVECLVNVTGMMPSTGNRCHRRSDSKISCLHVVVS